MRTLTSAQQTLVDANTTLVTWLFEVNNQYLNFDNFDTSGTKFKAGDTILGATSGATATVDRVVWSSTTAGKLMLSNVSGTFQNNEIIYVVANGYGSDILNGQSWYEPGAEWNINGTEVSVTADGTDLDVWYAGLDIVESAFYISTYEVTANTLTGGIEDERLQFQGPSSNNYITNQTINLDEDISTHTVITQACSGPNTQYFQFRLTSNATGGAITIDNCTAKQITTAALANGTVQGMQYYWSTKTWKDTTGIKYLFFDSDEITFGETSLEFGALGREYAFKVISETFNQVEFNLPFSQYKTYVPNELNFEITNSNNDLTASDFEDATVLLRYILSDSTDTETICEWKYVVEQALPLYEKIKFVCKDFVSRYLEGDFPTTQFINDLFDPGDEDLDALNSEALCVPESFGTCYIPLKSVADSVFTRGYVLGPDDYTYTVSQVCAPRVFGASQVWTSAEADFNTATKTDRFTPSKDYYLLFPYLAMKDETNYSGIHDGGDGLAYLSESSKSWTIDELINDRVVNDTDSSAAYITDNSGTSVVGTLSGGTSNEWNDNDAYHIESTGLWKYGGEYQNILTKFYRSDRSGTTKPEDVIETFLNLIGIGSDFIDTGTSFSSSGTSYADWGLEYNGAFYYKRKRAEVLAELLYSGHSTIDVDTSVKLRVLEKASQMTLDNSDILRDSFTFNWLNQTQNDSGYVAFQEDSKPQDKFLKLLVKSKNNSDNPSSEILTLQLVQDSQNVQKAGTLFYQRKLGKEASITLQGKTNLLPLQPGDVITIDHSNYGSSFDVVVDKVILGKTGWIKLNCTKYKYDLDDWDDLSPDAVSIAVNTNATEWSPIIAGPDSASPNTGTKPYLIPGKVRIGGGSDHILIDPVKMLFSLVSGSSDILRVGNLNGYLDYSGTSYGFAVSKDGNNYISIDPDLGIRISASGTSAITIKSGGNIDVQGGGDIYLTADDSNPARIVFASTGVGGEQTIIESDNTANKVLFIRPNTDSDRNLFMGTVNYPSGTTKRFDSIQAYVDGQIHLKAHPNSSQTAWIDIYRTGGGGGFGWVKLGLDDESLIYNGVNLYNSADSACILGHDSYRFSNTYTDDITITNGLSAGNLKTTYVENSVSIGSGSSDYVNMTGSAYGLFGVQVKKTAAGATLDMDAFSVKGIGTSYEYLDAHFTETGGVLGTDAYTKQYYIQSSGEIFWYMALRDKSTKKVLRTFASPDHPAYFHTTNDPKDKPHPWLKVFNPNIHEIIVSNLDKNQLKEIDDLVSTNENNLSRLQILNEMFVWDESEEEDWYEDEITIGLESNWKRKIGKEVKTEKAIIIKQSYMKKYKLVLKEN